MKLVVCNFLRCNSKKCTNAIDKPLKLNITTGKKTGYVRSDIVLEKIIRKMDWESFNICLTSHGLDTIKKAKNDNIMECIQNDVEWSTKVYEQLFGYDIINGDLTCSNCNHVFPIKNGIPNMLLQEDEV